MNNNVQYMVHQPNLLRVMVELREWENTQCNELQTLSGRDLYFRIAAGYLDDANAAQHLKLLQGRMTERSTRQRMREFEQQGLIHVASNASDQRTKQAVPTDKFFKHLNEHLAQFKHLCDAQYVMVEKHN